MKLKNLIINDLNRTVFSPLFATCTAISVFFAFLSIYWDLTLGGSEGLCVVYLLMCYKVMGLGNLYLIISVIPSIRLYNQDIKSNNILYQCIRANKVKYAISKAITSFVSAFLVVSISDIIFTVSLLAFYPLTNETGNSIIEIYGFSNSLQYIVAFILGKALCVGLLAVLCLLITTKFNNIFVVAASPYLIMKVLEYFSDALQLTSIFSISDLVNYNFDFGSFAINTLYITVYFMGLSTILSAIFIWINQEKE